MTADIVRLVRQCSRDIGICTSGGEEDSEVPYTTGSSETHDWQADKCNEAVEDNNRAADVIAVAEIGG